MLASSSSFSSLGSRGPPVRRTGTRSTLGAQTLSTKSSAPSFSFGSGPSRIHFDGAAAREGGKRGIQPSVGSGLGAGPGPIYNPAPARKWLGDAPAPHFGTQQQRPLSMKEKSDISRLTGKSKLPGPGQYAAPSSLGTQALGRSRSTSAFSFGTSKQRVSAALHTASPGAVYDVPQPATFRGNVRKASYSFGHEVRNKALSDDHNPGPGVYAQRGALGHQPSSTHVSGRTAGFGNPRVNTKAGRSAMPLEGRYSPGPIYMAQSGTRKQTLSTKRSMPVMGFPRSERFGSSAPKPGSGTPGPGEYII